MLVRSQRFSRFRRKLIRASVGRICRGSRGFGGRFEVPLTLYILVVILGRLGPVLGLRHWMILRLQPVGRDLVPEELSQERAGGRLTTHIGLGFWRSGRGGGRIVVAGFGFDHGGG